MLHFQGPMTIGYELPCGTDEFGLPGLVVMALAFVIVILLARRLRVAPTLNR